MNIGFIIAAAILLLMGLLFVGIILAEERIKSKYSQSYERWHKQWSGFRRMGLHESASIIRFGHRYKEWK